MVTGMVQTTLANNAGFHLVAELVPGPYEVGLEKSGFDPHDFDKLARESITPQPKAATVTVPTSFSLSSLNPAWKVQYKSGYGI